MPRAHRGRLRWRVPGLRAGALAIGIPGVFLADLVEFLLELAGCGETAAERGAMIALASWCRAAAAYIVYAIRDALERLDAPAMLAGGAHQVTLTLEYGVIGPLTTAMGAAALVGASLATSAHATASCVAALARFHPCLLGAYMLGMAMEVMMD